MLGPAMSEAELGKNSMSLRKSGVWLWGVWTEKCYDMLKRNEMLGSRYVMVEDTKTLLISLALK